MTKQKLTRGERRREYFQKQKAFLKNYTGTIQVNDILIRMGGGQVVDAEIIDEQDIQNPADIKVDDAEIVYRKHGWVDNPVLIEEFIARCVRQAKKML